MANEVAKADKKAPIDEAQLPAYLQNTQVIDDDNFDSSDIVLPKIKLLQGLSGEVEQFDEAKSGRFWHTGLDVDLGEEIKFAIADRRKKYLLTAPLADGQGILARADDAATWDRTGSWKVKLKGKREPVEWVIDDLDLEKSGLTKWGTSNPEDEDSPPAATLFYDYLVYLPDFPDLGMSIISLARSSIRPAKKGLNDKIAMQKSNGRPMQSLLFVAKSVEETGDEGPYKNWHFRSGGFVQDEAIFNMLIEHKDSLANVRIKDEVDDDVASRDDGKVDDGEGKF